MSNTHFTDANVPVEAPVEEELSKSKTSRASTCQFSCRICLSSGSEFDGENNLISPCKWIGSVKYIHELWLKAWLNSKRESKETPYSQSYYWKDLSWELCKTLLPDAVMWQEKIIKILDYQLPKIGEYVVLEGAARHNKNSKIIHVLNLGMKDAIKLGRGHESNIRISDISVSRCHAIIKYFDKKFYIEDNNSKFGTLIGFTEPIWISGPVWLQVGRSILNLDINRGNLYCGMRWKKINLIKAQLYHITDINSVIQFYPEECKK